MTTTFLDIPVDNITVPEDRARDLDPAWVEALAAIIARQGLLQPIIVTEAGPDGTHRLVAGLHRLQAVRGLDQETISARISPATNSDEARLEEVMENLGRHDLIALDRCHHLFELKHVWERMHPTAKFGGGHRSGKSLPTDAEETEIYGFGRMAAEKVGLSKRAINLAAKIWAGLSPTSRRRLGGTGIAHKQTELKALSEQKAPVQAKILDLILGEDHPDIANVAGALAFLEGGVAPAADEKLFRTVRESLSKLPDPVFDRLLSENADRVLASLKRLGRL